MEKQNKFLEQAETIIQECEDQIKDLEEIVNIKESEKDNNQTNSK